MPFQVGIGSLGRTVFFQVGHFTPVRTMRKNCVFFLIQYTTIQVKIKILMSNQIAGFFDHQYLQKGLMDLLDFLSRKSNQECDKSKINTFSWVWLVLSSHTYNSWNFPKVSLDDLKCGVCIVVRKIRFFILRCITKMVLTNQDSLTSLKWINRCLFETISIFFLKKYSIINSNFFFQKIKTNRKFWKSVSI